MAMLTIMLGSEKLGERALDKPTMAIGRDAGCEIQIDDVGTSRRHCEFVLRDGACVVRDLGSANGTFVNGRKIQESPLNDGDQILVGKHTAVYSATGVAAREMPMKFGGGAPVAATENTLRVDTSQLRAKLNAFADRAPGFDPLRDAPAAAPRAAGGSMAPLAIGIALLVVVAVVLVILFTG